MSKLEVDVAGVSVVKGELTTIASGASQDQADNNASGLDESFVQRVRFTALAITMFWITACCLYAFVFQDAAILAALPAEQVVVYLLAAILPVLAIWLGAFNMMQAHELRRATALMNNSFLAMTYPTDQAQGRVSKVVDSLSDQAASLHTATERAREQIAEMEELFRRQTEVLRTSAEIAEDRAKRIESMIGARSEDLAAVSDTLFERAETMQMMISQGALKVSSASAEATERTRIAHNILSNRADDLISAADKAATKTEAVSDSYTIMVRNLEHATSNARDQVEDVTFTYQTHIEKMTDATEDLAGRARNIADLMKREVDVIDEAGEKARERAERIEKAIEGHAESMNVIVEDSHRWVSQTADYFAAQTSFMEDAAGRSIKSINQGIDNAVTRVDAASRDFLSTTVAIGTKASDVSDNLAQAGDKLEQKAEAVSAAWKAAAENALEQVELSSDRFAAHAEDIKHVATNAATTMTDVSAQAHTAIQRDAEQIVLASGEAAHRTDDLRQNLRQASTDLAAASAGASEILRSSSDDLDRKRNQLTEAADGAMAKATELSTVFEGETARLTASAERAGSDVNELRETVESAALVLRSLAQDIVEKSRGLERSLSHQSELVTSTTKKATEDARQIEQAFASSADGLVDAVDKTRDKVRESSHDVLEQVKHLHSVTEDGVRDIAKAKAGLQEGAEAVADNSKTAVSKLKKLRDALDEHDEHAKLTSDRATERLMSVSEILEIVSNRLTELAEEAVAHIDQSATNLSAKTTGVGEQVKTVVDTMIDGGKALEKRTQRLAAHARDTRQALDDASSGFSNTSEALSMGTQAFRSQADMITDSAREIIVAAKAVSVHADKADRTFRDRADDLAAKADSLASRIEALDAMENAATQGAFVKTANNIMESLGSLAIDLDRMMETDVPDQVWKQYQSGDTSAFAKRLLRVVGPDAKALIGERFKTQSDFREHVIRYVRQFEGLLGKAMENERTDALAGTLLSSNMGKLYVLLAQSINRLR